MSLKVGVIGSNAIARRAHLPGFSKSDSKYTSLTMRGYKWDRCEDTEIVAVCVYKNRWID